MVTVQTGLFRDVPLWCTGCNDVHRYKPSEIERIVYALHGAAVTDYNDAKGPVPSPEPLIEEYDTCWDQVLRWAGDTEMFREHVEASVESRVEATVNCPAHDDETGPHHHPECHYWDEEHWQP